MMNKTRSARGGERIRSKEHRSEHHGHQTQSATPYGVETKIEPGNRDIEHQITRGE